MQMSQQSSFTFRDTFDAIKRHRGKAVTLFVLTMGLVTAALIVWPRSYRSEAKLFVRPTVKQIAQDPSATKEHAISVQDMRNSEVASIRNLLTSRGLLQQIADKVGVDKILGGDPDPGLADQDQALRREKAVRALYGNLDVSSPRDATVIDVQCDAKSPELAQEIVRALTEDYLDMHVQANRSDGSLEFFEQRALVAKQELDAATENLRLRKNDRHVASIAGKRLSLEQRIAEIEAQTIQTDRELRVAQARIGALQRTLNRLPERELTEETAGIANNAADQMRGELYRLQAHEQALSAKYTPAHPQVIAVRQQIAELTRIYDEQRDERTHVTTAKNEAYQRFEVDLLAETANAQSLEARAAKLADQHLALLEELKALNQTEVEIMELERQVQLAEANYRTYSEKREQARMYGALETERISNVAIVQPATLTVKAVSPKKGLVLVLAFFVAITGAIGIALIADSLDSSLRTRDDIERSLQVPVLVSIPRVSNREVLLN